MFSFAGIRKEAISGAPVDVDARRKELAEILARLTVYARSFRWESRNTDTDVIEPRC